MLIELTDYDSNQSILISIENIIKIRPYTDNTSLVTLSDRQEIHIKESFLDIKRILEGEIV